MQTVCEVGAVDRGAGHHACALNFEVRNGFAPVRACVARCPGRESVTAEAAAGTTV